MLSAAGHEVRAFDADGPTAADRSGPEVAGRLPWRPMAASFTGLELAGLELLDVKRSASEIRLQLKGRFRPSFTKILRMLCGQP